MTRWITNFAVIAENEITARWAVLGGQIGMACSLLIVALNLVADALAFTRLVPYADFQDLSQSIWDASHIYINFVALFGVALALLIFLFQMQVFFRNAQMTTFTLAVYITVTLLDGALVYIVFHGVDTLLSETTLSALIATVATCWFSEFSLALSIETVTRNQRVLAEFERRQAQQQRQQGQQRQPTPDRSGKPNPQGKPHQDGQRQKEREKGFRWQDEEVE